MSKYSDTITELSKLLVAQYEGIFEHRGNKGDSREKILIEYLERVFPYQYGFSKGEVFDCNGDNTGEVDVIIYDRLRSVIFRDSSEKILAPVESTYGIIEVKSNLTTGELDKSIEKLKKYNALMRREAQDNEVQFSPDITFKGLGGINLSKSSNQRINIIFAYQTDIAQKTLIDRASANDFVDCIIVPRDYCYIGRKREGFGLVKDGIDLEPFMAISEESIAFWSLYLQIIIPMCHLISVDKKSLLVNLLPEDTIISPSYEAATSST